MQQFFFKVLDLLDRKSAIEYRIEVFSFTIPLLGIKCHLRNSIIYPTMKPILDDNDDHQQLDHWVYLYDT